MIITTIITIVIVIIIVYKKYIYINIIDKER